MTVWSILAMPFLMLYAMVGSIQHAIVYGIHHVACISMPHDHVVCFSTIWDTFKHKWRSWSVVSCDTTEILTREVSPHTTQLFGFLLRSHNTASCVTCGKHVHTTWPCGVAFSEKHTLITKRLMGIWHAKPIWYQLDFRYDLSIHVHNYNSLINPNNRVCKLFFAV